MTHDTFLCQCMECCEYCSGCGYWFHVNEQGLCWYCERKDTACYLHNFKPFDECTQCDEIAKDEERTEKLK